MPDICIVCGDEVEGRILYHGCCGIECFNILRDASLPTEDTQDTDMEEVIDGLSETDPRVQMPEDNLQ